MGSRVDSAVFQGHLCRECGGCAGSKQVKCRSISKLKIVRKISFLFCLTIFSVPNYFHPLLTFHVIYFRAGVSRVSLFSLW